MRSFTVIITVVILLFFCLSCGNKHRSHNETNLLADDQFLKAVPKEAKSRDELVATFGTRISFGCVQRAEFSRWGRQIFAVWYDPFSGVEADYLHAYYYDPSKSEWILFINRRFDNEGDLSADMSSAKEALVIRNSADEVVLEQSVTNLPAENWDKQK